MPMELRMPLKRPPEGRRAFENALGAAAEPQSTLPMIPASATVSARICPRAHRCRCR